MEPIRCPWAKSRLEIHYHDTKWCRPIFEDQELFKWLILEGMQAGLSWRTILDKEESMMQAFDYFHPEQIASYTQEDKELLLTNPNIIRNRRKIDALVTNAKAFLELQAKHGSFSSYIWEFSDGKPINHALTHQSQMPANNPLSDAISKDLYKKGFRFVGSTICYSYMQAIGMVNDHLVSCFCYSDLYKE